jgi:geranylgeranyl reductase family protein
MSARSPMSTYDCDVAVVGAGPAGATVARTLADSGVRALLLERASVPRYKTCAGGIPLRTAALLPFSIKGTVEDEVHTVDVSYHGRRCFEQSDPQAFACMVMRDCFDALLVEQAVGAGARLEHSTRVRRIERAANGFLIETDRGKIHSRFVAGADGANSQVARWTGLGNGLAEACAIEAEVVAPEAELAHWRGRVNVDFGYQPSGYGWVFPKARRLSIGLVLPPTLAPQLRTSLQRYLEQLGLDPAEIERMAGHKVRFRRHEETIAGPGALLVGDAAGLVDEFTEEGIFYAIRSGQIAARFLARAIEDGHVWLGGYQRAIDRELMPELRAARTIARLFYGSLSRSPDVMLLISHRLRYLWEAFFRVQRGESSYYEELRRIWVLRPLAQLLMR